MRALALTLPRLQAVEVVEVPAVRGLASSQGGCTYVCRVYQGITWRTADRYPAVPT